MDPSARDINIKKKRTAQIWPPGILTKIYNKKTRFLISYYTLIQPPDTQ